MLGIFGRTKPLTTMETLQLEKDLSLAKKIHYILELETKICSLDKELNKNNNLRKVVHRLKTEHNAVIYKEVCNCDNKTKAKLNKNGTPRKHFAYRKDWAS